ncbi:hypothetical protein EJV44_15550, partial [Ancylobacter aquaticus]
MRRFGFGFGIPSPRRTLADLYSYIAALFTANEQGLWLDPSDLSTLFQDTAGATPVTAPGQTVALARDKSGRGNHLVQPVALSRPTLGRHPVGGRRNLLTYTEDFSNAIWAPDFGGTVTKSPPNLSFNAPSTDRRFALLYNQALTTVTGQSYVLTGTFIPGPGGEVIAIGSRSSGAAFGWVSYDTATGTSDQYTISTPYTSISFLGANEVSAGVWRMSVLITANGAQILPMVHFGSAGQTAAQLRTAGNGAGTLGLVSMQLVLGSDPGAYQRVTSDWDVTEVGKADCWYLGFDGIDDFMVTAATLDLSATDKVTMFAGVQKFTDAAIGIVAEFSGNVSLNAGTFYLVNGDGSSNSRPWSTSSRGTVAATSS